MDLTDGEGKQYRFNRADVNGVSHSCLSNVGVLFILLDWKVFVFCCEVGKGGNILL